jgi:protein required for attachment to host cells
MPKEDAMKPLKNLYLLAADRDFRLLCGSGSELVELAHRRADDFADVRDHFAAQQSRGHTAHVSYDTVDRGAHLAEERSRFARHVLAALEAEWSMGACDRIVLAAGPKMLGALRDVMPKALAAKVAAELPKDLIKTPLHDLPTHFSKVPGV